MYNVEFLTVSKQCYVPYPFFANEYNEGEIK